MDGGGEKIEEKGRDSGKENCNSEWEEKKKNREKYGQRKVTRMEEP